jgi:hypothetical protein
VDITSRSHCYSHSSSGTVAVNLPHSLTMAKRASPDNGFVIDLTSPAAPAPAPAALASDKNNKNTGNAENESNSNSLSGIRKRHASHGIHAPSASSSKRVKAEAAKKTAASSAKDDDDDDDIVVLDSLEANALFCPPTGTSASATTGDDIELVGTKNQVLLPHMRQHCTIQPFQGNSGLSTAAPTVNSKFCCHCYCYVCDIPVSECTAWEEHCQATDQGTMAYSWKDKRDKAKSKEQDLCFCRYCMSDRKVKRNR